MIKGGETMTDAEIIYSIHKALNLSRAKFGEKIGVSESVIKNIELRGNKVKPLMADLICKIYNVNPAYIETGEGDMFTVSDDFILDEVKEIYNLTDQQLQIIKNFLELDDDGKEMVIETAKSLAKDL